MKKILIAVDDTKTSRAVVSTFQNAVWQPEHVILLHVQRLEGRSLMIDMLGDAELSTLQKSLEGTAHQEELDKKSERILSYYRKILENNGSVTVDSIMRAGRPAEEILDVADEEGVDLIILGHTGRTGLSRLIQGSVARDVQKSAQVPVLLARKPVVCEQAYSWKDAYTAITVTTILFLGMLLFGAAF